MAAESDKKKNGKFKAIFARIGKFFREIKSEIKKITWPAPKVVTKNTIVVLVAIAIIGVFVFALDFGLNRLLSLIMEVSPIA
jgi:preprotein translocase subunit SecE